MAKETSREGSYLGSGPCLNPECGSSDAAALYSTGWVHCFSCGKNYKHPDHKDGDDDSFRVVQKRYDNMTGKPFVLGEFKDLPARKISLETCRKARYMIGKVPSNYPAREGSPLFNLRGRTVQIENFYEENNLVGQKLRDKDKNFAVIGTVKHQLWNRENVGAGGKLIVVTEGAIDAMSYMEVRKNWPAVSIPNGVDSAKKCIAENIEFLETFETVILAFDNDAKGQKAVEDCKFLLSSGRVKVAKLSQEYKDFNEALCANDPKAILNAIFEAEEVRPDGLVSVDEALEEALKPLEMGLPWFLSELTHLTYGRRYTEVYTFGAGTGVGKTDFLTQQIAYDVDTLGLNVGVVFLEQQVSESIRRIAGKIGHKKFHVPDAGWTQEELVASANRLKGKITFYASFGETDWSQVKMRIRHMAVAKGIRVFYIDHLTAMADTADEKGSLEQIMKEVAGLANELKLIIHLVSHLTTPEGKPHEEGGRVTIRHFKGSRAIGFWSYFMFGLERNQQAEDPDERSITTFRVLKDRYSGQATGETLKLGYDVAKGLMIPLGLVSVTSEQLRNEAESF